MELLDDVKEEQKKKPIFSLISLSSICMFFMMMYYVGNSMDENGLVNNELPKFTVSIALLAIGILTSIISFVRYEKPKVIRFVSAALHLFMILTIAAAIIFEF